MNKVFLVGRLTRDPDLRYSAGNSAIVRTSIAVDRQFQNQAGNREADFISVVAFGNRAEVMKKYLTKGSQIAICGRIQTGSYDGQDGKRVYTTDVVIDEFQFLDTRGSRNQAGSSETAPTDAPSEDVPQYDFPASDNMNVETDPFKDFGDKIEIDDSDLPF